MKKSNLIFKVTGSFIGGLALVFANMFAANACATYTYQPKVPEKLRKQNK